MCDLLNDNRFSRKLLVSAIGVKAVHYFVITSGSKTGCRNFIFNHHASGVVNKHIESVCSSLNLSMASNNRTINYHLVATILIKGGINSVLFNRRGRSMRGFFDGVLCSFKLCAAFGAVDYGVIATFTVTGRIDSVFLYRLGGSTPTLA